MSNSISRRIDSGNDSDRAPTILPAGEVTGTALQLMSGYGYSADHRDLSDAPGMFVYLDLVPGDDVHELG
jgi:hypothetical protein